MKQFQNRHSSHRIPVRVSASYKDSQDSDPANAQAAETPVLIQVPQNSANQKTAEKQTSSEPEKTEPDWETVAKLRLAEMDNFRKRQLRRAKEAIAAERDRLLRLMLPVADNLDRALKHNHQQDQSLQTGVKLTQREFNRVLEAEGVTRIETVGHPFNPEWHEALATTPNTTVAAHTIVEEVEAGYKLGGRLLRPAKVVVST